MLWTYWDLRRWMALNLTLASILSSITFRTSEVRPQKVDQAEELVRAWAEFIIGLAITNRYSEW